MAKVVTWERVLDNVTINGTGNEVTIPLNAARGSAFSAKLIIDSGTTTKVKLETQVIESDQGDPNLVGVAAASAEQTEANKSWDVPEQTGVIVAEHTSGRITKAFTLPATKWYRLKVTGVATNGANTKVSLWVCNVESF